MIPGNINTALISGAEGGGYQISRSLRFNSADSAYLSRTPASAGNRTAWSWSAWIKRTDRVDNAVLFGYLDDTGNTGQFVRFLADGSLDFSQIESGSWMARLIPTQVFRDFGAWFHLLVVWDSANGTANSRHRIYINGTEVTTFAIRANPSSSLNSQINARVEHAIGTYGVSKVTYTSAYLADVHFIDGQALTPSSFTEVSATTGRLEPKAYSGPTPTGNSFWLPFSDNSAATATTLGKDGFLLGNNWTPSNLSVSSVAKIYANTGALTTSSGVIANGDTPYWIDVLPSNAHLDYYGVGMGAVHDTSLSNPVYWVGDEYTLGNVLRARFDLRDYPTVSSARIYSVGFSGYVSYYARFLDASKNVISGTNVDISPSSATWTTVPVSGSPRYLEIYTTSGVARRLLLYAIEVNGGQLVNILTPPTDSLVDTPTSYGTGNSGGDVRGNYCTYNPLVFSAPTLSNGNLDAPGNGSSWQSAFGSIQMPASGKWYWEVIVGHGDTIVGVSKTFPTSNTFLGGWADSYGWYGGVGRKVQGPSNTQTNYASFAASDVIGVAYDAGAGSLTFYKNGASQGSAFTGLTGEFYPVLSTFGAATSSSNFGQRPFAYTAPSGFKALCDTNLPAPTIARPSTVMDVRLYTGNGSTQTISGLGFSPDLVWIKSRSQGLYHFLVDTVRGNTKTLSSNTTDGESFATETVINSFDSSGFTLNADDGAGYYGWNMNSASLAAWCFDAGTTTTTNTQGSITSQVRANASAGFSVVTAGAGGYFGGTVGHGLGVAPGMIILKDRNGATGWRIYHSSLGNNFYLDFTTAAAINYGSSLWGVTSSAFGSNVGLTNTAVAYCFAPVAGYSAFGSYTGNSSADGPFVYTGFRPRWVMVKGINGISGNEHWVIKDALRPAYNPTNGNLYANLSLNEDSISTVNIDLVSNGFKIRGTYGGINTSAVTYSYAAFAESPFQFSRAR